jgi:uncharacterized membrane protein
VRFSAGKLAKMGMFVALAIVLKLPILSIPNVEFFTFIVFSAGYLFGLIEGAIVGGVSMSLYTTFNPYGLAPLPIAFSQVFSMILIGISGGIAFKSNMVCRNPSGSRTGLKTRPYIAMAMSAIVLTLIYDLLTNLAVAYTLGNFMPVMVAAIPFSFIHIASNLAIFVVLTPVLFKLAKMENR